MPLHRQIRAASGGTVNGDDPGVQSPDRGMTRPNFGAAPRPAAGRGRHRLRERLIRFERAGGCRAAAGLLLALAVLLTGTTAHAQTVVYEATITVGKKSSSRGWSWGNTGYGKITSRTFSYKGTTYRMRNIYRSGGTLTMTIDQGNFNDLKTHLKFRGEQVGASDKTVAISSMTVEQYRAYKSNVNLNWNNKDVVTVKFTTTEPGAPQNLRATTLPPNTSAVLNWAAPASIGGSGITKYQYRQKEVGGSWGSWANIANSASLTTYTVTGLTATKTYAFQMRAFNSTDAGQWSNEATNHPPPAAPADVTATTGGLRQVVLLSWTAATTAARITKYQYRLSDDGGSTWDPDWTNIVGSGASTTSYTVSGLEDATPYTVELRAFNAGGASPAVRKTVTTAAPPDAPENLTATPGDQQVTLRWQRPATGGSPILAYQVRKKKGSGSFDGWAHIANSARLTSHTVGALEEDKSYTFELRALNAVGNGAVASVEGGTLAPPAAPENLTATPGVEQVTLSWTTAFDGGSAITTYQVRRKAGSGSFGGWDDFGGLATTSHTVTSLDAAQSYTFEVRAENVLGEGAVASVEGRTLGPPEPPENLHATPAFEQVTLSWTTPGDGGSAITTYHVRRKTGSGSFGNWTNIPGSGPRTKSHTVPDLTNGAAYTFELRAVSAVGPGEGSSVTATPAAPPTAPLELTASPGEGAVTLRWKAPQPAADRAGVTVRQADWLGPKRR